jgi:hypothetical protein
MKTRDLQVFTGGKVIGGLQIERRHRGTGRSKSGRGTGTHQRTGNTSRGYARKFGTETRVDASRTIQCEPTARINVKVTIGNYELPSFRISENWAIGMPRELTVGEAHYRLAQSFKDRLRVGIAHKNARYYRNVKRELGADRTTTTVLKSDEKSKVTWRPLP